ncbi:Solute carrier family 35 member F1-like protein [Drosera capensis]
MLSLSLSFSPHKLSSLSPRKFSSNGAVTALSSYASLTLHRRRSLPAAVRASNSDQIPKRGSKMMMMKSAVECLKDFCKKKMVVGILLGQFLSLLTTSTGFSSSELARRGVNAPTSQSFANYVLLGLVYGSILLYRRKPLKAKWYYYILLGLTKYKYKKLAAGSNPLKGDLLVVAGSTLYAVSNVSEEFLVKNADRVELMAMLGLFGAIISACQVLPFIGFAVAMFLFYSLVPVLLKTNGSAMLNLSLLTGDMWTVLIRIFAYHQKVDWLYFVAFAAVAVGLFVYSWGQKNEDRILSEVADESAHQSKNNDEEANDRELDQEASFHDQQAISSQNKGL